MIAILGQYVVLFRINSEFVIALMQLIQSVYLSLSSFLIGDGIRCLYGVCFLSYIETYLYVYVVIK